jgi:MFS family permease
MGLGGVFGSLLGAFITENCHPKWAFLAYSIPGLVVMFLGLQLEEK